METKPALKTTEFWIQAVLQIFFLLNTLNVYTYLPDTWSGIIQAILAGAYFLSRGQAKTGIPYKGTQTIIAGELPDFAPIVSEPAEPTSTVPEST